jgi:hypothetical protein
MADKLFTALQSASDVFVSDFNEEERAMILDMMDRMIINATEGKYDPNH